MLYRTLNICCLVSIFVSTSTFAERKLGDPLTVNTDYLTKDNVKDEGKQSYARCEGCHSANYNRTGPLHCNVMGRQAGTLADFKFSMAMKNANIVWNETTLDQFLKSPLDFLPGTTMTISGIGSAQERQLLISYLRGLDKDNVLCQ